MDIPHITVILNWRNYKNASGCYSIHLRITINRTSKYFKIETPKKVTPQQWVGCGRCLGKKIASVFL
jgi:hypothetical protein